MFFSVSSIISIITSLLGLTTVIVIHEFGHFLFAKLFNVYTPTFSIGIGGGILYSKKIGQTNFCISAAPIGGYVEIASEKGENGTKGFNQIPYLGKVLIMLGGILFNFILTYLIFAGLLFTGMPESGIYEVNKQTIVSVPDNSINDKNLKNGDKIIELDGELISTASTIKSKAFKTTQEGKSSINAAIIRENLKKHIMLNINKNQRTLSGLLGANFERKANLGLLESFIESYTLTKLCLTLTIKGFSKIFSRAGSKALLGPIATVAMGGKSAQGGFSSLLLFLAIISLSLGFINLLPLPIFDGGQFVLFTIEAITGRSLSEKTQNIISTTSWILMLGLMVIFSIKDIYSLISY